MTTYDSTRGTRGPIRLILINSGVYDYAEIELDRPLHLVGPNNSGKTTLISALQFLYIDNFSQMTFSHSRKKTREYYFPDKHSFILFECLTPTGIEVVGLRGRGQLHDHDFQRFAFQHTYERDDFIEEQTVRPWDSIKANLMRRNLRKLSAGELRDGLLSHSRTEKVNLGLVPLENTGRYESFSFIFKNLLRLADLGAGDFKNLLIDINRGHFGRSELDLRDQYEDEYEGIRREREAVSKLDKATENIRKLLNLVSRRDKRRRHLRTQWEYLAQRIEARESKDMRSIEDFSRDIEARNEDLRNNLDKLQSLKSKHEELQRTVGHLRGRLEDLQKEARKFRDFDVQEARRRHNEFDERRMAIKRRIEESEASTGTDVERRLRDVTVRLQRDREQLEQLSDTAITWLRKTTDLDDHELDDVFRILNPKLLTLRVRGAKQNTDIRSPSTLRAHLTAIADGFADGAYADDVLQIAEQALSEESATSDYGDVAVLRKRIKDSIARRDELQQTLDDIKRREELERELAVLEKDFTTLSKTLHEWELFQERLQQREQWTRELNDYKQKAESVSRRIESINNRHQQLRDSIAQLESRKDRLDKNLEKLKQGFQKLQRPASDWPTMDDAPLDCWEERSLLELISDYENRREALRNLDSTIRNTFHAVDLQTDGQYAGTTNEETLDNFREEIEGLEQRHATLQKRWDALVENLSGELKQLDHSLKELRGIVSKLTRRLNEHQISNLQSIQVQIQPRQRLVKKIQYIVALPQAQRGGETGIVATKRTF